MNAPEGFMPDHSGNKQTVAATMATAELQPSLVPWVISDSSIPTMTLYDRVHIACARAVRWEFWPTWLFYMPIVIWILLLGIRYRAFTLFTAANPGIADGGLVGEEKDQTLLTLQQNAPDLIASCQLLSADLSLTERLELVEQFAARHGFPLVLKPNIGQRGRGVMIVRDIDEAASYLQRFREGLLLQRYVTGEEYGVFVALEPGSASARILSVAHKSFPSIVGDGQLNLQQLILSHPRARLLARVILHRWRGDLQRVPAAGEKIQLVEVGAHCRGSTFTNTNHLVSEQLMSAMTRICHAIPGFYFGRIDLRAPSNEELQQGINLSVMEVNGVSAESAHIYHPGSSLFAAWRDMFRQWKLAFKIGSANRRAGAALSPALKLWQKFRVDLQRNTTTF